MTTKRRKHRCPIFVLLLNTLLIASFTPSNAIARDFWIDANTSATGEGSQSHPFKTIQSAASLAQPGDTIHVKPGVYREHVMPERGGEAGRSIIYKSEKPHAAILKGSDVFAPAWRNEGRGLFSGPLEDRFFTDKDYIDGGNPYRIAYASDKKLPPVPYKSVQWTLGQVFVNGLPLRETSSREELAQTKNAWWFDPAANRILINLGDQSPQKHLVELTTRRGVFRPKHKGLGYIEVRGFVFEHCSNQFPSNFWTERRNAQSGMVGTRGGHHWIIADNIFRHAKTVGLTFGISGNSWSKEPIPYDNETPEEKDPPQSKVGFHQIERNIFEDNGAIGAMGFGNTGVRIRDNLFTRNNALANTSYETGGIKTHLVDDIHIEQNRFMNNECMGLWLDNTWKNARVNRNIFSGNRGKDIFFEMDDNTSKTAALVDCNIFLPGRPELIAAPKESGKSKPLWHPWSVSIYGHDADGIRIMHNLFVSDGYGLYFRKITERKGGAANIQVTGNIFCGGKMTAVCLPLENPPVAKNNDFQNNIYPTTSRPFVLTGWSHPKGWPTDRDAIARILTLWKSHGAIGKNPAEFPFGDSTKPPVGYALTLQQWQAITRYDRASRSVRIDCTFDPQRLKLTLSLPAEVARIDFPKETSLDIDFFGITLSTTSIPGPFQELNPGKNVITLSKALP